MDLLMIRQTYLLMPTQSSAHVKQLW